MHVCLCESVCSFCHLSVLFSSRQPIQCKSFNDLHWLIPSKGSYSKCWELQNGWTFQILKPSTECKFYISAVVDNKCHCSLEVICWFNYNNEILTMWSLPWAHCIGSNRASTLSFHCLFFPHSASWPLFLFMCPCVWIFQMFIHAWLSACVCVCSDRLEEAGNPKGWKCFVYGE